MIAVLRIGHRQKRDERVSTHCGLVSRALGASEIIYSGEKDDKLLDSVRNVTKSWGGPFKVSYAVSWKPVVTQYRKKKYSIVHLTMYGIPLRKAISYVKKAKNVLVIIGSEKVPREVYKQSDFNIAVTNQPHSEIAALALFINEYSGGKALSKPFKAAKIKVVPQERGKKVVERDKSNKAR